MKCAVCFVNWPGDSKVCPQCQYDHSLAGALDSAAILKARAAFKERTLAYAPETRVTRKDKLLPWLGLLLGLVIFVFWIRACSSGGFRHW